MYVFANSLTLFTNNKEDERNKKEILNDSSAEQQKRTRGTGKDHRLAHEDPTIRREWSDTSQIRSTIHSKRAADKRCTISTGTYMVVPKVALELDL